MDAEVDVAEQPTDNLQVIYDKLKSANPNLPDYPTFKNDMGNEDNLKSVYNKLSSVNKLPDFNTFKNDMLGSDANAQEPKTSNAPNLVSPLPSDGSSPTFQSETPDLSQSQPTVPFPDWTARTDTVYPEKPLTTTGELDLSKTKPVQATPEQKQQYFDSVKTGHIIDATVNTFASNPIFENKANRDEYYKSLQQQGYSAKQLSQIQQAGEDAVTSATQKNVASALGTVDKGITGVGNMVDNSVAGSVAQMQQGEQEIKETPEIANDAMKWGGAGGALGATLLHGAKGLLDYGMGVLGVTPIVAGINIASKLVTDKLPEVEKIISPAQTALRNYYESKGQPPPTWLNDAASLVDFGLQAFAFHGVAKGVKVGSEMVDDYKSKTPEELQKSISDLINEKPEVVNDFNRQAEGIVSPEIAQQQIKISNLHNDLTANSDLQPTLQPSLQQAVADHQQASAEEAKQASEAATKQVKNVNYQQAIDHLTQRKEEGVANGTLSEDGAKAIDNDINEIKKNITPAEPTSPSGEVAGKVTEGKTSPKEKSEQYRVHVGNADLYSSDKIDDNGYVYFDNEKDAHDFTDKVQDKTGDFLNIEKVQEPASKTKVAETPPATGATEQKSILNSDTDLKGDGKESWMNHNKFENKELKENLSQSFSTKIASLDKEYEENKISSEELDNTRADELMKHLQKYFGGKYTEVNGEEVRIADHQSGSLMHGRFEHGISFVIDGGNEIDNNIPSYSTLEKAIELINDKTKKVNIKKAISENYYNDAISEGRMTANDAATIIRSAGLEVPKDISDLAGKDEKTLTDNLKTQTDEPTITKFAERTPEQVAIAEPAITNLEHQTETLQGVSDKELNALNEQADRLISGEQPDNSATGQQSESNADTVTPKEKASKFTPEQKDAAFSMTKPEFVFKKMGSAEDWDAIKRENELKVKALKDKISQTGEKIKSALKVDLPEGTQKSGLGIDDLVDAAVKIIHSAIDAGVAVKEAIAKGIQHIKDNWDDKWGEFKEEDYKKAFNPDSLVTDKEKAAGFESQTHIKNSVNKYLGKEDKITEGNPQGGDFKKYAEIPKDVIDKMIEARKVAKEADAKNVESLATELTAKKPLSKQVKTKIADFKNKLSDAAKAVAMTFEARAFVKNKLGDFAANEPLKAISNKDAKLMEFAHQKLAESGQTFDDFKKVFSKMTEQQQNAFNILRGEPTTSKGRILQDQVRKEFASQSPAFKAMADALKQVSDYNFNYLKENGLIDDEQYVKDYFYGVYDNSKGQVDAFLNDYRKTTARYTKEKTFLTPADAMAAGLELKIKNPMTNLEHEMLDIANRVGMKNMRDNIIAQAPSLFATEGKAPVGYKEIKEPLFKGMMFQPDFADYVKNLISTNKVTQNKFLNAVNTTSNLAKSIQFAMSLFHTKNMLLSSVFSSPLSIFDPRGYKDFLKATYKHDAPDYIDTRIAQLGGKGRYSLEQQQSVIAKFVDKEIGGADFRGAKTAANIINLNNRYNSWQFNQLIPELKNIKNKRDYNLFVERNGREPSDSELINIIKKNQNIYGEMNEKLFGRRGTTTSMMRLLFTAPGYAEGNMRNILDAMYNSGVTLKQLATGDIKGLKDRFNRGELASTHFVLSTILGTVAAASMVNYMLGNPVKTPQSVDDFRDMMKVPTGDVDKRGNKMYLDGLSFGKDYMTMGYLLTSQNGKWNGTKLPEDLGKRLSGMLSVTSTVSNDFFESLKNGYLTDYKGDKVFYLSDDFPTKLLQFVKYETQKAAPFVYQGAKKADTSLKGAIESFAGFIPVKSEADKESLIDYLKSKDDAERTYKDIKNSRKPTKNEKRAYDRYVN